MNHQMLKEKYAGCKGYRKHFSKEENHSFYTTRYHIFGFLKNIVQSINFNSVTNFRDEFEYLKEKVY